MMAKFELSQTSDGQFRFVLKAANGEIIARGERYASRAAAHEAIEALKTLAPGAAVESPSSETEGVSAPPKTGLAQRLLDIAAPAAAAMKGKAHSLDHADLLYDADGLPR